MLEDVKTALTRVAGGLTEDFKRAMIYLVQNGHFEELEILSAIANNLAWIEEGAGKILSGLDNNFTPKQMEKVELAFSYHSTITVSVPTTEPHTTPVGEDKNVGLMSQVRRLIEEGITGNVEIALRLGISSAQVSGYKAQITRRRNQVTNAPTEPEASPSVKSPARSRGRMRRNVSRAEVNQAIRQILTDKGRGTAASDVQRALREEYRFGNEVSTATIGAIRGHLPV